MNLPESINPRELLKAPNGKKALSDLLEVRGGYVPQEKPLNALFNSIRRGTPLLAEGVRGGGKSAMGEALSDALGLKRFYLQCMSGLTIRDVLYQWDETAQRLYVEQQVKLGVSIETAQLNQWTLPFLQLGEVLAAYNYSATTDDGLPPVLIIDEIDKLDEKGEDFLLQILARGYANVPRLAPDSRVGILPEIKMKRQALMPIVLLTSNNMRSGVSSPLRSRARYTYIKAPTFEESIRILAARVSGISEPLLIDLSMVMRAIEGKSLKEKPALREYIEFAETCVEFGIEQITVEVLSDNIDTLAKCEKDIITLDKAFEGVYTEYISEPDAEVINAVKTAFSDLEQKQSVSIQTQPVKFAPAQVEKVKDQPLRPMYPLRQSSSQPTVS
jgi:MoxR-like ATPase